MVAAHPFSELVEQPSVTSSIPAVNVARTNASVSPQGFHTRSVHIPSRTSSIARTENAAGVLHPEDSIEETPGGSSRKRADVVVPCSVVQTPRSLPNEVMDFPGHQVDDLELEPSELADYPGALAEHLISHPIAPEPEELDAVYRSLVPPDWVGVNARIPRSRSGPLDFDRAAGSSQVRAHSTGGKHDLHGKPNPTCQCFTDAKSYVEALGSTVSMLVQLEADTICHCETCRAERANSSRTDAVPDWQAMLPSNWVCFELRCGFLQAKALNALAWDIAYHSTTVESLPKVLATGRLVKPGDRVAVLDGHSIGIRKDTGRIRSPFWRRNKHTGQNEWFDPCQIFLSPSLRYCCLPHYSKAEPFTAPSGLRYAVRMSLQVRLRPGTYSIGHQTVGVTNPIDPYISNDSIEYYTPGDEHGSHVLTRLLVGMERI